MVARSPQYSDQVTLARWLQSEAINPRRYPLRALVRGFECHVSLLHRKKHAETSLVDFV